MIDSIPVPTQKEICNLAADLIDHAAAIGDNRWGMTPFPDGFRINVGWIESLTIGANELRLIVIGASARALSLPGNVRFDPGTDPRGRYPSCPGSMVVSIPLLPLASLRNAIQALRPALFEAATIMGRRRIAKGVRAGHRQFAVQIVEGIAGRPLPSPPDVGDPRGVDSSGPDDLMEGALRRVTSSVYERNPEARKACIAHYGMACVVCNFSFEKCYGEIGKGFIHVHHLVPLAARGKEYQVDPIADLRPVCPNCHAMLHAVEFPIEIEVLKRSLGMTACMPFK